MMRGAMMGALPLAAMLAFGAPETADYERIGADAEPLRSAFNADVGKVRILMLVAPT